MTCAVDAAVCSRVRSGGRSQHSRNQCIRCSRACCDMVSVVAGAPSVLQQLQAPWSPPGALLFLMPLLAALVFVETQADRFPALADIQDLLAETVLPLLQKMEWWVSFPRSGIYADVQFSHDVSIYG